MVDSSSSQCGNQVGGSLLGAVRSKKGRERERDKKKQPHLPVTGVKNSTKILLFQD